MDKIIKHGEPESVKVIQDGTNELSVVSEKLSKLMKKQEKIDDLSS
jgi:hypothetical protein